MHHDSSSSSGEAAQLYAQAVTTYREGQLAACLSLLGQAVMLNPQHADAWGLMGAISRRVNDLKGAAGFFARAAKAAPLEPEWHYNHALTLLGLQQTDAAAEAFETAIRLHPGFAEAHLAYGHLLHEKGALALAEKHYRSAIAARADFAPAYMNLANLLRDRRALSESLSLGQRAVELDASSPVAWANFAMTLQEFGCSEEAIAALERAIQLKPDFSEAHSRRLFYLNYLPGLPAAALMAEHRAWGRLVAPRVAAAEVRTDMERDPQRRLRIGYISGDFHAHPVGYFLAGVLASHAAEAVETYCYGSGARVDDMTHTLRAEADHWRDISTLSDDSAAELIRADCIDILIELSGHTAHHRLGVFERRPAPLQASWLGYVGSTGSPAIDYLLIDAATLPAELADMGSEQIVPLAQGRLCYTAPAYAPLPSAPPSALGHPVTFGSFNYLPKMGADVVRLWAQIVQEVPGSRLLLKWPTLADEGIRAGVVAAFAAHGIDETQLLLRSYSPHAQMLAEYAEVDIALDPFPFGGGLTTCEALWMGVPVITWPQQHPASRQTYSMLQQMGVPELVADSEADYVARAKALAGDPQRLSQLREGLRGRMQSSAVGNPDIFTPTLETALRSIWMAWCARVSPS